MSSLQELPVHLGLYQEQETGRSIFHRAWTEPYEQQHDSVLVIRNSHQLISLFSILSLRVPALPIMDLLSIK
jgi:hypothetical protein